MANLGSLRAAARRAIANPVDWRIARLEERIADLGRIAALQAEDALFTQPRYQDPLRLLCHRGQFWSQYQEDGVIAGIFARIGTTTRVFVEIGAGNGRENTTRALLETGWEGVWVDGGADNAAAIRQGSLRTHLESGRLALVEAMVGADNINDLVLPALAGREVDLLSVDIDMGTSHAWRALRVAARACCIEYNASVPAPVRWEAPAAPDAFWDGTAAFGASLKTLEDIGREKAMSLVGCDAAGINAYFVRDDLAGGRRFAEPFDAENHWEPPRYHLAFRRGHPAPR